MKEYVEFARKVSVYPSACTNSIEELMYLALGLSGEAGEIANKVKKLYRDEDSTINREKISGELGDVLWYFIRISDVLGVDFNEIVDNNIEKLSRRLNEGKLKGSGDER